MVQICYPVITDRCVAAPVFLRLLLETAAVLDQRLAVADWLPNETCRRDEAAASSLAPSSSSR